MVLLQKKSDAGGKKYLLAANHLKSYQFLGQSVCKFIVIFFVLSVTRHITFSS